MIPLRFWILDGIFISVTGRLYNLTKSVPDSCDYKLNCLCRNLLTKWDILSAILALFGITLTSVPPIRYVLQSYNLHSGENKSVNSSFHGHNEENTWNRTLESTHDKQINILLEVSVQCTVNSVFTNFAESFSLRLFALF